MVGKLLSPVWEVEVLVSPLDDESRTFVQSVRVEAGTKEQAESLAMSRAYNVFQVEPSEVLGSKPIARPLMVW